MSIGLNIKNYRKKNKLTQGELGKLLGVGTSAVSSWEIGKNKPLMDNIQKMSDIFNVNVSDLLENDVVSSTKTSKNIVLPMYGDVAAGALAEMESVDVGNTESVELSPALLGTYANSDNLFAMRVNGDSMDRVIPNGSLIVVKPIEETQYKDGDIVVFSYNNEYSLKRFRPNTMEGFVLFEADSENDDFKDIPISKTELFEANMYGKVVLYVVSL